MSDAINKEIEKNDDEVSVIAHLLEIEKQASQILSAANITGDKNIAEAKIAADLEFKKKYSEKASGLQNEYEEKRKVIQSEHDGIIGQYKASVESKPQNTKAFSELMDKLLWT